MFDSGLGSGKRCEKVRSYARSDEFMRVDGILYALEQLMRAEGILYALRPTYAR